MPENIHENMNLYWVSFIASAMTNALVMGITTKATTPHPCIH